MGPREQLQHDGYLLLRQAIPAEWLPGLRKAFDAGITSDWPVPRGWDWRHALVDDSAQMLAVCQLPQLLAAAGVLIGERFFLSQVEGREPVGGGGYQRLHRDLSNQRPGDTVGALAFLDDFGPENGATRLIPASHRPNAEEAARIEHDESLAIQISGQAGDILVFDVDLLHAACLNPSGAHRRSLLINYAAEGLYDAHQQTAALRQVRMDTSARYAPGDFVLASA